MAVESWDPIAHSRLALLARIWLDESTRPRPHELRWSGGSIGLWDIPPV